MTSIYAESVRLSLLGEPVVDGGDVEAPHLHAHVIEAEEHPPELLLRAVAGDDDDGVQLDGHGVEY